MSLDARAGDTILDHPAEVVVLVPVDERVVNADVGVAADQDERGTPHSRAFSVSAGARAMACW